MRGNHRSSTRGITIVVRVVLVVGLAACTGATGDVSGGEPRPFDASTPELLKVACTEPTYPGASPTSWPAIYRDFFGCHSRASCAGNGTCHSSADKTGARASNFVCGDVDGCWDSIRHAIDPSPARMASGALVKDSDAARPEGAYLFNVVRFRTPDGQLKVNLGMPQIPTDFAYSPADVDRIQQWIKAGAKNQ